MYLLGKSTRDGNRGMNDPGEVNPEKIPRNKFSNLHDKGKIYTAEQEAMQFKEKFVRHLI